ncbi:hypothetical protein ACFYU4_38745 [Streptomyces tendae]|uniref:hypothetical protein n=1 Tax=Streptomyces tendae TaxID=1932 RepID=UPI00369EFA3A
MTLLPLDKAGGETMTVKLGVWVSSTTSRRDRLNADQLAAPVGLGMDRARPVVLTQIAPHSL